MKNYKLFSLILCCILITTFCFAEESENETEYLVENETFYDETNTEALPTVSESYDFSDDLANLIEQYPDIDFSPISDVSVRSVNPITPSATSGLKSALLSVLGNYDAIVVEYAYQNTQGYTYYEREIQPDYVWLCACAILLITVYSLFKFVGGLFSGKR